MRRKTWILVALVALFGPFGAAYAETSSKTDCPPCKREGPIVEHGNGWYGYKDDPCKIRYRHCDKKDCAEFIEGQKEGGSSTVNCPNPCLPCQSAEEIAAAVAEKIKTLKISEETVNEMTTVIIEGIEKSREEIPLVKNLVPAPRKGFWFVPISVIAMEGFDARVAWVHNIDPSIDLEVKRNLGGAVGIGHQFPSGFGIYGQVFCMGAERIHPRWAIRPQVYPSATEVEIEIEPNRRWGVIFGANIPINKK